MSLFGGLIAGAAEGGGRAVEEIADANIDKANKIDMARELSEIEELRATRLAEAQEQRRRSGSEWDHSQTVKRAPELRGIEVEDKRAVGVVENETAVARAQGLAPIEIDTQGKIDRNRAETELAFKSDKRNVAAERRLAEARNVETASERLTADAKREELREAQALKRLRGLLALAESAGDKRGAEAIKRQIAARFYDPTKKNGELDYETVEIERELPPEQGGGTEKTTSKRVRQAGSPNATPQGGNQFTPDADDVQGLLTGKYTDAQFDEVFGKGAARAARNTHTR